MIGSLGDFTCAASAIALDNSDALGVDVVGKAGGFLVMSGSSALNAHTALGGCA